MFELQSKSKLQGEIPRSFSMSCNLDGILTSISKGLPTSLLKLPISEIFDDIFGVFKNLENRISANDPCIALKIKISRQNKSVELDYGSTLIGSFDQVGKLTSFAINAILIEKQEENILNEDFLETLLYQSKDFIGIFSLEENKQFFTNKNIYHFLGYQFSEKKILWQYADLIVHPEDLPSLDDLGNEMRRGKKNTWELYFRAYHMNGSLKFFHMNVFMLNEQIARPKRFVHIIKDITGDQEYTFTLKSEEFIHQVLMKNTQAQIYFINTSKEVESYITKEGKIRPEEGFYIASFLNEQNKPKKIVNAVLQGLDESLKGVPFTDTVVHEGLQYSIDIAPISSRNSVERLILIIDNFQSNSGNKKLVELSKEVERFKSEFLDEKDKNKQLIGQIKRLRISLDIQKSFFIKYSVDGEITYINRTFGDFIKSRPSEVVSGYKKPEILIDDLLKFNSAMSEIRAFPNRSVKVDYRIVVDGVVHFTNWELSSLKDHNKEVTEIIASGMDITQQMLHQSRIQESEERFRLISNATNEAIWDWNILTNESWWNLTMYEFLGFSHEVKADINTLLKAIHPEDKQEVQDKINQALSEKKTHWSGEFRAWVKRKKEYRYFYNRAYLNYNADNIPERMLASVMDITERKLTELKFKELNERFELAVKAGKTGIWQYNIENNHFIFDNNLLALYDIESSNENDQVSLETELLSLLELDSLDSNGEQYQIEQSIIKVFGKRVFDTFKKALNNYLQKADYEQPFEFIQRRPRGRNAKIWILSRATVVFGQNGKAIHLIGTDTDITAQKEAEEKMRIAKQQTDDAMRTQENFFSVMSHEIRSPLSGVIGMNDLLLRQSPRSDQKDFLSAMKFSADSLLVLINDLLDFSKIKAGKLEFEENDFDLKLLLKNTYLNYKTQTKDKNINFDMNKGVMLPRFIRGDLTRLSQILNNLLSNAIKFTKIGSVTLNVTVKNNSEKRISLLFEVKDTGIGIPLNKQQKIFKPFEQASKDTSRKYGGTGLGLSIVKNLVELQGGSLDFESTPGKGTTFKVLLHYKREKQKRGANTNSALSKDLSHIRDFAGLNVLYIDDVATNQLIMRGFATRWGIRIDTATDGYEGLHKIQEGSYDLVLMDLQMPGIDGYETTRRIRSFNDTYYKQVPIIALTADISNQVIKSVNQAGLTDYLSKPVNFDKLYQILKKHHISPKTENKKHQKSVLVPETQPPKKLKIIGEIDFSEPDRLFINEPEGYLEFLDKSIKEFKMNQRSLVHAVLTHDYELFRQVHHKMTGLLHLLKLYVFSTYLSEVKGQLSSDIRLHEDLQSEMVANIDGYFKNTLSYFERKLSSITEINKK